VPFPGPSRPTAACSCDQLPLDYQGIPGYLVTGLASCDQIRHRGRRTQADRIWADQSARCRPRRECGARGGGASSVVSLATGRIDKSSDVLLANTGSVGSRVVRPIGQPVVASTAAGRGPDLRALVGGPTKDQPVPTVVRCRERQQDVAPG
jgi:hypothetical protein